VTHSHPDHYAGLGEVVAGADVPIYAPQGVIDTITADDALKDQIVGPMFGEDWPTNRVFPNTPVADGESVTFDDVKLTVIDLGPSESPHDSPWILGDDAKTVFLGDQIYDHKHCYLADGFYAEWLANIEKLRARFADGAVFYIGHGGPVGPEMWDWQRGYIELFVDAVSNADWSEPEQAKTAVVGRMKEYEPSDELQFLMELSIEPIAAKLGLLRLA
jgi:glyoxylase-like metal-dependent hydrolase (beta-lactamase superfamily II)